MIIIKGIETPQTIWNNPISYRFISSLSDVTPFTKALSHHYADDKWTSNACHGNNFHRRELKFSDVVLDTITNFKNNFKKSQNLNLNWYERLGGAYNSEKKIIWHFHGIMHRSTIDQNWIISIICSCIFLAG